MPTRNLDKLFAPRSVAVIGASGDKGSVGHVILRNLLAGGFTGPIMPVNPHRKTIAGVSVYADIDALPQTPDLAVICTPPEAVPTVIDQTGKRGIKAAIVVTAGLSRIQSEAGESLQEAMLDAARRHGMRLLGPNCLGLMVPRIGLNASFAHLPALAGKIAFVSQSGALGTAVLDWARARGIGFSAFVSLGDMADLGFGDMLDYLGSDPETRAILLYIEAIRHRRNFMSAARAAARNKPVLVVKAGRSTEGKRAAQSHTGALAGADGVYDAAIRRAGMLRVFSVEELFAAVETLARIRRPRGDRLAILTNGGGIGVMAADRLIEEGGRLAELSAETMAALDAKLPATWSRGNPVDIVGDAPGNRYTDACRILAHAPEADALLVMHAPTAVADSTGAARAVIDALHDEQIPILTSWVGGETVAAGRALFSQEGFPTFDAPETAVRAFMHLIRYRRNQDMLMETPPSIPAEFTPSVAAARLIVEEALARAPGAEGVMLDEPQSKAVLAAYGIPTVKTHVVRTPAEAAAKARAIGFPVALKILAEGITHKSDVGGVDLFLGSMETVERAAKTMLRTVATRAPAGRILGFTVQAMVVRPGSVEAIIGAAIDPVFGPVILFGQGGIAVETIMDREIALPPLNMPLARELISRTRISRLMRGGRGQPGVDMDSLCLTLVRVSQMIVDIPEIMEMDVNPLLIDATGVLALDARIRIAAYGPDGAGRLAIRPYPKGLEETFALRSGRRVLLRPIRPEDEPEHYNFIAKLTPQDIRFRFFGMVRELPHSEMARFTQIDYDREMAFIATAADPDGKWETLGVVRTATDPDNERAEFAIVVRSDLGAQGLGHRLLEKMIDYCRARGTRRIVGQIMIDNARMRDLARNLGFTEKLMGSEGVVETTLELQT